MSDHSETNPESYGLATGEITDHVYDGIQEFDNPLPGWWTALFYITILYSIGYGFISFARPEWTDVNLGYEDAKKALNERLFAQIGDLEPDHETLTRFMSNPEDAKWLEIGRSIFEVNCISCHGKNGEGVSGPNLTDDSYKNVVALVDIPKVVAEGAAKGQMPAWGNRLGKNEIVLVSAYVANLRGTNAAGKAPEGEVIPAWGAKAEKTALTK